MLGTYRTGGRSTLSIIAALALYALSSSVSAESLEIVNYQLISKTKVASSSGNRDNDKRNDDKGRNDDKEIYEYVYRADLRNDSVSVYDARATISNTARRIEVIQGNLIFGLVLADKTITSSNTFTIRANNGFDKHTKNGHDKRFAGKDDVIDWKVTAKTDSVLPVISVLSPKDVPVASAKPPISAQYKDAESGVDVSKTRLLLDGVDVSGSAMITTSDIRYQPTSALAEGSHTLELSVTDRIGNTARSTWSFSVDTVPPAISTKTPADGGILANTMPAISAQYQDIGGVNISKVQLTVDGANVTGSAAVSASGISYKPGTALAQGSHSVVLTVVDVAGNSSQSAWNFIVDTVPPVISALAPVDGSYVQTATPAISAQYQDANAIDLGKVQLTVDGANVTGSAAVSASGISYKPGTALAQGSHSVVLTVVDVAGNSSQSAWNFIVDTVPPVISALAPVDGSYVQTATPAISAQYQDTNAIDLGKVQLTVDGANVTGSAAVSATGISYKPGTALAQGSHTVVLTVTDNAGNSTQSTWSFVIDITPPVISGEAPKNIYLASGMQTLSAQYLDAGTGVDSARTLLTLDGVDVTASAAVANTGITYPLANTLAAGTHQVVLTVYDKAGNMAQSNWSFSVDTTPPTISSQQPLNNSYLTAPTASISAQYLDSESGVDTAKVKLLLDKADVSATATITATGISYQANTLADGLHQADLSVYDKAGNLTHTAWQFTVDTMPPAISTPTPPDASIQATSQPAISAQYQDANGVEAGKVSLTVDGANVTSGATITASGISYLPATPLAQGSHAIVLTVTDLAGNNSQAAWNFSVDTMPPAISVQAPSDGSYVQTATPTISAQYQDVGGIDPAKVTITLDGVNVSTGAIIGGTGLSYQPTALVQGTHTVLLSVADKAGNTTQAGWSFVIDITPPVISGEAPKNIYLASGTQTLSAQYLDADTGIDPARTLLTLDGVDVTASATVANTGITYPLANTLAAGAHQIALTVFDKAGNKTQSNWSFSVDTTPPVISTQLPLNNTYVTNASPVISAQYLDSESGVDTARVKLLLDKADVSATATLTATGMTYPANALAEGQHQADLSVYDKAGNLVQTAWQFTVDTMPPAISTPTPPEASLNATSQPAISAQYQDTGNPALASGIDTAGIKLLIDGIDVSAAAQITATGISYTPAQALVDGLHTATLSITDKAVNTVNTTWTFVTDAGKPAIAASFAPAEGAVLAADALPTVTAQYVGSITGVDTANVRLEIDGQNVTVQSHITDTDISYTPALALSEGQHTVKLSVPNRAGTVATQIWTFKTATPPEIYESSPGLGNVFPSGAGVIITLKYRDMGAGVDPTSAKLIVDGADVTLQATVGEAETRLAPQSTLAQPATAYGAGVHTINFSISDKAGNTTSKNWGFEMEGAATTVISNFSPAKFAGVPNGTNPVISANYTDPVGIDPARVRIVVDNVDVTPQSSVTASGFSYQSATALAEGHHSIYLTVTNTQGREAVALWSFDIDTATAYNLRFTEPVAGKGYTHPLANVTVVASSDKAAVAGITLNGKPMSYVASNGLEVTYSGQADLVVGNNILQTVATYSDKRTKEANLSVNYDLPPTVTITAPLDRTTLGPIVESSPRDLTGNVERPVTITGHTNKPVQSVTINQQVAILDGGGTEFSFPAFFLHEGNNLITAVATDSYGRVATASVIVSVDQTAPFIAVESPLDSSVTSGNTIDLRGTVNDAVEGYYATVEPTVTVTTAKSSVTAQVADKQFLAAAVPLELGENTLNVTAIDQLGNTRSTKIKVIRVAAGSQRLTIYAGNAQSGMVGTALAQPLTVAALDQDGSPLANTAIAFDISRGTGTLYNSPESQVANTTYDRNLVVTTDANGLANVWLTLGKQSGPGSNAVHASAANIAEDVTFIASGEKGPPKHIRADLGINQYVATGTQPLEPLTAVVMDDLENRISNAAVTFTVVIGEALFDNGTNTITVNTDKNGYATARPVVGATPGEIVVQAVPAANADNLYEATFTLHALEAKEGPTQFSGVLMNDKGQPLTGARMSIGRTALSTTVDDQGLFTFDDIPPGKIDLFVDGRTVNIAGQQYPSMHFEATAVKGASNRLPHPLYMPQLLMAEAKIVGGDQDVILHMPGFEGYEMTVFANSVTFPDGSKTGPLVVSPISLDKLPMTPPGGYPGFMAPAATLQPSGTRFDPPVRIKVPNSSGFKPGEKRPVYQWDFDLATFVPMGQATVTDDGAFLITDPGTGISKAGWHPIPNPPPPDDCTESGNAPVCHPQCEEFAMTTGQCPRQYCKPVNGGAPCDDELYCTEKDQCVGGSCKGTKIEDKESTPPTAIELNLGLLSSVNGFLTNFGVISGDDEFKVSLETSSKTHCCESEKTFKTLDEKKGQGKASLNWGGPLPGVSVPIGKWGALGVVGTFGFGGSLALSKTMQGCTNDEIDCWKGAGNTFVEVALDGGLWVGSGNINDPYALDKNKTVYVRATLQAKGGFTAGVQVGCAEGTVVGAMFTGIQGLAVVELFDGFVHFETQPYELVKPYPIPGFSFSLPN